MEETGRVKGIEARKGGVKMEWWVILVLALVIPLALIPVAFIWYLNIGGIYAAFKEVRERQAALKKGARAEAEQYVAVTPLKKLKK